MNRKDVAFIRAMIEEGMSNQQIADQMSEEFRTQAADAAEALRFEEDAFGIDDRSRDDWSDSQIAYHDRLSMGQNEAGEWIGFM